MVEQNTIEYTSEERILSAVSHAAIILPYVGLAVPLGVWITQREKSSWVRFQALQAMVYQIMQYIFMMVAGCLMIPLLFGSLILAADEEALMITTMLLPFSPYMLWGLLILLGLLGGVLCAFGKNFQYPVLGRKIQEYITNHNIEAAAGEEND